MNDFQNPWFFFKMGEFLSKLIIFKMHDLFQCQWVFFSFFWTFFQNARSTFLSKSASFVLKLLDFFFPKLMNFFKIHELCYKNDVLFSNWWAFFMIFWTFSIFQVYELFENPSFLQNFAPFKERQMVNGYPVNGWLVNH